MSERRVFFESIHFEKGMTHKRFPDDPGTITITLKTTVPDPRKVSIQETMAALEREFGDMEDA